MASHKRQNSQKYQNQKSIQDTAFEIVREKTAMMSDVSAVLKRLQTNEFFQQIFDQYTKIFSREHDFVFQEIIKLLKQQQNTNTLDANFDFLELYSMNFNVFKQSLTLIVSLIMDQLMQSQNKNVELILNEIQKKKNNNLSSQTSTNGLQQQFQNNLIQQLQPQSKIQQNQIFQQQNQQHQQIQQQQNQQQQQYQQLEFKKIKNQNYQSQRFHTQQDSYREKKGQNQQNTKRNHEEIIQRQISPDSRCMTQESQQKSNQSDKQIIQNISQKYYSPDNQRPKNIQSIETTLKYIQKHLNEKQEKHFQANQLVNQFLQMHIRESPVRELKTEESLLEVTPHMKQFIIQKSSKSSSPNKIDQDIFVKEVNSNYNNQINQQYREQIHEQKFEPQYDAQNQYTSNTRQSNEFINNKKQMKDHKVVSKGQMNQKNNDNLKGQPKVQSYREKINQVTINTNNNNLGNSGYFNNKNMFDQISKDKLKTKVIHVNAQTPKLFNSTFQNQDKKKYSPSKFQENQIYNKFSNYLKQI